ncbi:MAG: response regulator transcription factor [Bryobacterales bacterium]|nr:response regulator transcription factor [Bryobacterales bacterium]
MQPRGTASISTVLADDEQLALDELQFLLKDFPEIEVVGTATNGLAAVERAADLEPDLMFLDVQMPGLDGMNVIRRIKDMGGHVPYFILATAYDQYAVEAFQLEALDYVLKPVERDRLAQAIARAQKVIAERARVADATPLALPLPGGDAPKPLLQRTKVLVKSQGRNFIVDAQDLIYATIDDGLISVVASGVEGISNYRTIEELQSNLDPEVFWRVHRSYLVNINRIKEVIPWFKSSFQLRMDDRKQTEIPVSRVQTKRLRALLKL